MPESGAGDLSPDGKQIVYSPRFRDFRTWKRYGGGQANDLFIFDLADQRRDADHRQPAHRPRPDVDRRHDLLQLRPRRHASTSTPTTSPAKTIAQLTTHDQWDVRWPSADDASGRIVYELDGELQRLRHEDGARRRRSRSPCPTTAWRERPCRISVGSQIEDVALSPKGERALFAARGDIFTAPIEKGPTRNLTHSSGAHDKWPRWSPDGAQDRVHLRPDRRGRGLRRRAGRHRQPEQLTKRRQGACATRRSGRPTASASPSATRTASVYVLTRRRQEADARSPTRRAARSATTPGRRAAITWRSA